MDSGAGLGIGGHQSARARTDEWLTPPEIITALGAFDLDPCSPRVRPWWTAKRHFSILDNGLAQPWDGRVWCNPPYGAETGKWLARCAAHGNAIALIFARTETESFRDYVWLKAAGIMFLYGRLHFYDVRGQRAKANAGGPSCLVAYDRANLIALWTAHATGAINGKVVEL